MKIRHLNIMLFSCFLFVLSMNFCYAQSRLKIVGTDVNLRSGAGTNYSIIKKLNKNAEYSLVNNNITKSNDSCSNGWYQIYYEGTKTGYVCRDYTSLIDESGNVSGDIYDRPWTSPKSAIVGGAKFISSSYISKGQFTSYLKKFNVNPNGSYKVYNHQYMANLAAPYSEAYTSYKSYKENNLLSLPLEFTIPVFNNMPDYTYLPGKDIDNSCQNALSDQAFESALNTQQFPESYKCKLRLIHNSYPNWTFKALHTNLDFNSAVTAEKSLSSIQGGDKYYDLSSGSRIQTENGWYIANRETVSYYLDPRNFLNAERILMFESLTYSDNYTSTVVQSVLKGTFMAEYSFLDNMSYADIFVEAGKTANMSPVYLASLAKQESGNNGSKATSGAEFTYKGVTYKGLFNFFNIGASSSAESPILEGLVWASGGSDNVKTSSDNSAGINSALNNINVSVQQGCLIGFEINSKISDIKNKLNGYSVSVSGASDDSIIKTGQVITISNGSETANYTIVVKGDVDGDGGIGATDYVKIKNYIMEKSGSELNISQSLAADADNNNSIGATDYVKIKNSIMGR